LTEGSGALLGKTSAELKQVAFRDTSERMITLGELCTLVAGRAPLLIEVKSHFDGDRRLVRRMAEVLASYDGPAAGMSFDPDQVTALRETIPSRPRGGLAGDDGRAAPRHDASASRVPHPAALRGLLRRRPAGGRAMGGAQHLPMPALDLDRAHAASARHRRAACRPDDFRGLSPGSVTWRRT
jgi:glycerophosphoryl diester phosphodiesterase